MTRSPDATRDVDELVPAASPASRRRSNAAAARAETGEVVGSPVPRKTARTAKTDRAAAAPGGSLAARLAKIGLRDRDDCVLHLPLRYEDETRLSSLADARDGDTVQIDARVVDHAIQYRPRRQLVVRVDDVHATGPRDARLTLRFLHFYGSQVRHFEPGTRLRIRGELRNTGHALFGDATREMIHPRYAIVDDDTPLPDRLTPVYPSGVGLGQAPLRRAIAKALDEVVLDETVPAPLRASLELPPIDAAIRLIHNPPPDVSQASLASREHPAWRRVKFDELLAQQLSLAKAQAARRARTAPVLGTGGPLVRRFVDQLPFALTGAQRRVVGEIAADLGRPHPMQRLLQGDVGSGKTVVAAIAALQAVDAGWQAVLMAPTEILAEQHFTKLAEWVEALDVPVAWLTGRLTRRAKADARDRIESGHARLVIGTHALIQEDVHFARLGLAIVDEQHRFGVGQRLALRFKARAGGDAVAREPHQLMMSATPIPRTLAMTYFADLDVSTIDALPPGRRPIATKLVDAARRDEVIARVHAAVRSGRQAYWVCPLVEGADDEPIGAGGPGTDRQGPAAADGGSRPAREPAMPLRRPGAGTAAARERLALQAAVDTHASLAVALPDVVVGLVHGRLPATEKASTMRAFNDGAIDLLVATTVIEVGVDVPNASLMVIEHAERFGLAQLHQLRGRVGRGSIDSVCILLYRTPLSATARERLKTMHETQDGFAIAKKDLELRGPGEFLGHRQSGEALLRFADLQADEDLVDAARTAAVAMRERHPDAVERHLHRWLRGAEELLKA